MVIVCNINYIPITLFSLFFNSVSSLEIIFITTGIICSLYA